MSNEVLMNLPIERAVLAGICQYGLEVYVELDFLQPEYFSHELNQVIFTCLQDIINCNQNIEFSSLFATANIFCKELHQPASSRPSNLEPRPFLLDLKSSRFLP